MGQLSGTGAIGIRAESPMRFPNGYPEVPGMRGISPSLAHVVEGFLQRERRTGFRCLAARIVLAEAHPGVVTRGAERLGLAILPVALDQESPEFTWATEPSR